jgi:hypothetical protein
MSENVHRPGLLHNDGMGLTIAKGGQMDEACLLQRFCQDGLQLQISLP